MAEFTVKEVTVCRVAILSSKCSANRFLKNLGNIEYN